jgi:Kef-type K+ transport system membrane component KefB
MRQPVLASLLLAALMFLSALPATAQPGPASEHTAVAAEVALHQRTAAPATQQQHPFAFILLELSLLIGMVIVARWLSDRFRQPVVLAELIVGVALGNIGYWLGLPFFSFIMDYGIASPLFEQVWRSGASVVEAASHVFGPKELVPGGKGYEVVHLMTGAEGLTNVNIGVSMWLFSSLGIVLLLFNVGLETGLSQLRQVGLRASIVAVVGVLATFLLALGAGVWLLDDYTPAARVFLAASLCATSIGISTRVFKDLGKQDTPEAQIVLGASVLNDLLGLVLLTVCIGLVLKGHIAYGSTAWIVFLSSTFVGVVVLLGDRFGHRMSRMLTALKANETRFLLPLAFAFLMGWLASRIGLSSTVGAFAAGLVLSGQSSRAPIKDVLTPMIAIFTPIFFLLIGMQVNLSTFLHWQTPALTAVLLIVAIAGKLLAGLSVGPGADGLRVGLGMLPRGEVALIFASIGKGLGVLNSDVYAALILVIIAMAFASTMSLRWSFGRGAPTAARRRASGEQSIPRGDRPERNSDRGGPTPSPPNAAARPPYHAGRSSQT